MIHTNLGKIAAYPKLANSDKTPIIFLHGVYFDHHLWDEVIDSIPDRTTYSVDMPFHGLSKEITKTDWTLNDCADMLLEILDSLKITKVIAVGHSWGSMTILRAASKQPERFESVLLCNMPLLAATKKQKITFGLQHSMLIFRNFYTKQAAKALFGKTSLKENPSLVDQLKRPMDLLSNTQIKQTDKAVIAEAEDTSELIKNFRSERLLSRELKIMFLRLQTLKR
jgi:3-oxoadipate enol-lactonase